MSVASYIEVGPWDPDKRHRLAHLIDGTAVADRVRQVRSASDLQALVDEIRAYQVVYESDPDDWGG